MWAGALCCCTSPERETGTPMNTQRKRVLNGEKNKDVGGAKSLALVVQVAVQHNAWTTQVLTVYKHSCLALMCHQQQ